MKYSSLKAGEPTDVTRLAAICGCDQAALLAATPHAVSTTRYRFGAADIKFTAFRRLALRACPACIREARDEYGDAGPFQLGVWQLGSIRTCHKHGCHLIEVPPLPHYRYVYDFARVVRITHVDSITNVRPEQQDFERYLIGRVKGSDAPSQRTLTTQEAWLDQLDFHVASQLCENFGLLLIQGPKANRVKTTEEQWFAAGAAGYDVLRHGPARMLAKLEEIRLKAGPGPRHYGAIYGSFLTWLAQRHEDPAFTDVRRLVFEYIVKTYPVPVGSNLLRIRVDTQFVYPLRKGARAFGIDERMLRHKLLAAGDISQSKRDGPITYRRYPSRELLETIANETAGLLRGLEAAEYIGLDDNILRKLVAHGLVEKAGQMARNAPYFRKSDLDGFIQKLRHHTTFGAKLKGDEVPFIAAIPACQCSIVELLHLTFENAIPLHCPNGNGTKVNDYLVSVARAKIAVGRSALGAISLSEAAARIGVNTSTVRNLVAAGYLREAKKTDKSAERWLVIDEASVISFCERHISAAHLARELRRDSANLCRELYKLGLEPLVFNGINRIIFRRRDVEV